MKLRNLFIASCCVLAISLVMNIVLGRYAVRFYRQLHHILLDPANEGAFGDRSASLHETETPIVVFVGDSRIARWMPMPSLSGCQIVNRGIGGETTAQTLLRFEEDVVKLKPSLAVIQVGINDLKTIGVFPRQSQHIIDSCEQNIITMVERLTANDITVVIMTVVPPGKPQLLRRPVWSNDIYSAVKKVNKVIRSLAGDRVIVLDCDTFMAHDEKIKPEYVCDTLHLSRRGYEELNKYLEPVLTELIESLNN